MLEHIVSQFGSEGGCNAVDSTDDVLTPVSRKHARRIPAARHFNMPVKDSVALLNATQDACLELGVTDA